MNTEQLIYSDLMFLNNIEDDFLEDSTICQKEYYQYLDRLENLKSIVDNINMQEVNTIIINWKPEEAVRYLFGIIDKIKKVS